MSPREHRASLRRDLQEGSYCAQFKTYHDEMKENENEEPPATEAELARVLESPCTCWKAEALAQIDKALSHQQSKTT